MGTVLDQTADTNYQKLYQFSKLYVFPEYVKQADPRLLSPESYADAPSRLFADTRNRQFPIDTKAATWLSALNFLEAKAEMHPKIAEWIGQRLDQYIEYHDIEDDIKQLRVKHAELHSDSTSQLPDSCFMLVTVKSGSKEREYPMRNAVECKKAAEWFLTYRDTFDFDHRRVMAQKLLNKVAEYGAGVGRAAILELEKHAGFGVYDPREAAVMLRNRAKAASAKTMPELRLGLLKLADQVETNPAMAIDPAMSAELCRTVDQFDRATGLAGKYDGSLPRPEDVIFGASTKLASEFTREAVELANGSIFEREQLGKVPLRNVRDLFGNKFAESVADGLMTDTNKLAKVASTLPRRAADTLEGMLGEIGETPIAKQASGRHGLSGKDLRLLAAIDKATK